MGDVMNVYIWHICNRPMTWHMDDIYALENILFSIIHYVDKSNHYFLLYFYFTTLNSFYGKNKIKNEPVTLLRTHKADPECQIRSNVTLGCLKSLTWGSVNLVKKWYNWLYFNVRAGINQTRSRRWAYHLDGYKHSRLSGLQVSTARFSEWNAYAKSFLSRIKVVVFFKPCSTTYSSYFRT